MRNIEDSKLKDSKHDDSNSLASTIEVKKPRVGIPDVPLSPRTKEILEENERIINNQRENYGRRRALVSFR